MRPGARALASFECGWLPWKSWPKDVVIHCTKTGMVVKRNQLALMITVQKIRRYLQARPFRPFRLFLSDGSSHEVPHPEFAWVFGSSVFVGVASSSTEMPEDLVKELSLLHVTRVEKLPSKSETK